METNQPSPPKIYEIPVNLASDLDGYSFFAKISLETWDMRFSGVLFDFINNKYFEGNLCAVFGALIEDLKLRFNQIFIINTTEAVDSLFIKNGFYSIIDPQFQKEVNYDNTIDYRKFEVHEVEKFQLYIINQLISQEGLPTLSDQLKKKINRSILEIFNNADIHGQCTHVFTAGEFNYKSKRLKFTIADMGITIRKNVNDFLQTGRNYPGNKCIEWAVEEGNTTKNGNIPGGLGFSLIREFLAKNKGRIQIFSSSGFWEEANGLITSREIKNRYLGTIVTFEFNMEDPNSYILITELDPKNVL